MATVRLGVISDTHLPGRLRSLPPAVYDVFVGVDAILHAGDLNVAAVLAELEVLAPVHAVLGNNEEPSLAGRLPERVQLEFGSVAVGMVHNSGPAEGRRRRMAKAFPECRVVVFGHSHIPMVDDDGSLLLVNPGSATQPRRAKVPTVAVLVIQDGRPAASLVELPAAPR